MDGALVPFGFMGCGLAYDFQEGMEGFITWWAEDGSVYNLVIIDGKLAFECCIPEGRTYVSLLIVPPSLYLYPLTMDMVGIVGKRPICFVT